MRLAEYAVAAFLVLMLAPERVTAMPPLPVQSPNAQQKLALFKAKLERFAINYLESVKTGGGRYVPPSQIDPRYTLALYVNAQTSGPNAQKMWVLQRDEIGGPWRLGLWDKAHWKRYGLPDNIQPPYSWQVSTGRKYPGDDRSGPTPTGVFALDERKGRMIRGRGAPGMINIVYIDYHYSSGRASGVAFHGTTTRRYGLLGRADSHGCIRMTKTNARSLLDRLQGKDGALPENLRWGVVPRFWRHQRGWQRYGYTRNGTTHFVAPVTPVLRNASIDAGDSDQSLAHDVLTKIGYRALAVIFRD